MLIDFYRAIEDSSVRMLTAARRNDWDEVVRCESACAVLIEQLRTHAHTEDLAPADRSEKSRIMRRILENDAQIRVLTDSWLASESPPIESQRWLH